MAIVDQQKSYKSWVKFYVPTYPGPVSYMSVLITVICDTIIEIICTYTHYMLSSKITA